MVESRDLICHEFGMLIVILVEYHVPRVWFVEVLLLESHMLRVWYVDSNADRVSHATSLVC